MTLRFSFIEPSAGRKSMRPPAQRVPFLRLAIVVALGFALFAQASHGSGKGAGRLCSAPFANAAGMDLCAPKS